MKKTFAIIIIIFIILCTIVAIIANYQLNHMPVINYKIKSIAFVDYNSFGGYIDKVELSKKDIKELTHYLKKIYKVDKYDSENIGVQCKPVFTYSEYLIIRNETNYYEFYFNGGCGDNLKKEGLYNKKKSRIF